MALVDPDPAGAVAEAIPRIDAHIDREPEREVRGVTAVRHLKAMERGQRGRGQQVAVAEPGAAPDRLPDPRRDLALHDPPLAARRRTAGPDTRRRAALPIAALPHRICVGAHRDLFGWYAVGRQLRAEKEE